MPSPRVSNTGAFTRSKNKDTDQMLQDLLGPKRYARSLERAKSKGAEELLNRFDENNPSYYVIAKFSYEYDIERLHEYLLTHSLFFEDVYSEYVSKRYSISNNVSKFVESIVLLNKLRENNETVTKENLYMMSQVVDKSLMVLNKIYEYEEQQGDISDVKKYIYNEFADKLAHIRKDLFGGKYVRNREIIEQKSTRLSRLWSLEDTYVRAIEHGAEETNPNIYKQLDRVRSQIEIELDSLYGDIGYSIDVLDDAADSADSEEDVVDTGAAAIGIISPIMEHTPSIVGLKQIMKAINHINKKGKENQHKVEFNKLDEGKQHIDRGLNQIKERNKRNNAAQKRHIAALEKKREEEEINRWADLWKAYENATILVTVHNSGSNDYTYFSKQALEAEKNAKLKDKVFKIIEKGAPRLGIPLHNKSESSPRADWEKLLENVKVISFGETAIDDYMGAIEDLYAEEIADAKARQDIGGPEDVEEVPPGVYKKLEEIERELDLSRIVNGCINIISEAINEFRDCVGEIHSNILPIINKFEDFFDAPLESILNVLMVALSIISTGTTGINISIGVFTKSIKMIYAPDDDSDDDDDDEDKENAPESLFMKLFSTIINFITMLIEGISFSISALQVVITFGLSAFTSTMTSILKLVKTIAKTSPLIDQIFNMVNMAFTLFTLPFSMVFSNATLDSIMQIILYIRDMGMSLLFFWQENANYTNLIRLCILESKDKITEVAEGFIKILPDLITFMKDVLVFVTYFIETLLSESAYLIETMVAGIDAAKAMLDAGIMTIFFTAAIKFTKLFSANADKILNILKTGFSIAMWCIDHVDEIMRYFELFCIAMGGVIAGVLGALGGAALGVGMMVKAAKKVGLKLIKEEFFKGLADYSKKGALIGVGAGAIIGELLYRVLFKFGEGGYIPPTPYGTLAIVAEKETEFIVPESKMYLVRGRNRIVINYMGAVYGMEKGGYEYRKALNSVSNTSYYS